METHYNQKAHDENWQDRRYDRNDCDLCDAAESMIQVHISVLCLIILS